MHIIRTAIVICVASSVLFGVAAATVDIAALKKLFCEGTSRPTTVRADVATEQPIFLPIPLVKQTTTYTCGAASTAAVLQAFGYTDVTEASMEREMRSNDEEGTRYVEIVRACQKKRVGRICARVHEH